MEVPVTDAAIVEVGAGPEKYLTTRERGAYDFVRNMKPTPATLSTSLQVKLFTLFLQGIDCVEIARLNQGISLGQVIIARIEGRWDEKRQDHIEKLLRDTSLRLQQTTLEGIDFIAAQLAAVHKIEGDRIKRFLQSGDKADLGTFDISSWKSYKEVIEILKTLTGADKKTQQHSGEIIHKHEHTVPATNRGMVHSESRAIIEAELVSRKKPR